MELWQLILAICGGIAAVGAAITYLVKAVKPARELLKRIDAQDRKLDNDNKRLNELEAGNKAICKALLALLNHELTGNSTDRLRDASDGLNQYLINR